MSRLPVVDDHGIKHTTGCALPGWTSTSPRIAGVHVLRCAGCTTVRLIRPTTERNHQ